MPALFRGIAFPFKKGKLSLPQAETDAELIRQSLIQIVLTAKGERVMRPEFGSMATTYIFENNDEFLGDLIKADLMTAIARFEPRVIVRDVRVQTEDATVIVDIFYVVVATRQEQSVSIHLPTEK